MYRTIQIIISLFLGIHYSQIFAEPFSQVNTVTTDTLKMEKDLEFGTTEEVVIGKFSTFAVDENDRVYIADQDQTIIFVFDSDGTYLRSIGRQGRGPAEFAAITPITKIQVHQNKLFVPDYPSPSTFFPDRMQIFSLEDYSFLQTIQLIPHNRNEYHEYMEGYFPQGVHPLSDDRFIVDFRRKRNVYKDSVSFIRYFILNEASDISKGPILEQQDLINLNLIVKRGGRSMLILRTFPFLEKSLFEVSSNNLIYTARTGDFNILVRNLDGDIIQTIRHPYKKVPLSRDKQIEKYRASGNERHADMIEDADDFPKYWPAIHSMFLDEQNRLWVATFTDREYDFKWFVLNETGDVFATFLWPADKEIKLVRNQYLYTLEKDSEGFSAVVRYKIEGLD